jgi:hypothetical protein
MDDANELANEVEGIAERFHAGWHEGIKIDATDLMTLEKAAQSLRELATLRTECDALRKDAERLDAMQTGKWALFTPHWEGDRWHIMPLADGEKWEAFGATLREVIDAALKGQSNA